MRSSTRTQERSRRRRTSGARASSRRPRSTPIDATAGSSSLHPARLAVDTIDAFAASLARQAPLATGLGRVAALRGARGAALPRGGPGRARGRAGRRSRVAATPRARRQRRRRARSRSLPISSASASSGSASSTRPIAPSSAPGSRARSRPRSTASSRRSRRCSRRRWTPSSPTTSATPRQTSRRARRRRNGRPRSRRAPMRAAFRRRRCRCSRCGARSPTGCSSRREARLRKQMSARRRVPAQGERGRGRGARARAMPSMREFLRELAGIDGLAAALDVARALPPPRYDDDSWTVIDALLDILPRVAAELTLVFRAAGAIDFTQAHARRARGARRAGRCPPTCCCGSTIGSGICSSTSSRTRPTRSTT